MKGKIEEIVFVEVKSRKLKLNGMEKSLKRCSYKKEVKWEEYKIDEDITP